MDYDINNHKFTLRLEPDLKAKLKEEADKEHRSLTGEIIYIIEQYLEKKD